MKGEPNQIRLFETYASPAAYQSHLQSEHFEKYKIVTASMVKSLRLIRTGPGPSAQVSLTAFMRTDPEYPFNMSARVSGRIEITREAMASAANAPDQIEARVRLAKFVSEPSTE